MPRAPATRASCSAMPAERRRTLCLRAIYYSHKVLEVLSEARKAGKGDVAKLGPDAKSQITVRYVGGKPSEVTGSVLSTQHLDPARNSAKVRKVVEPYIREALGDLQISPTCNWLVNPTASSSSVVPTETPA